MTTLPVPINRDSSLVSMFGWRRNYMLVDGVVVPATNAEEWFANWKANSNVAFTHVPIQWSMFQRFMIRCLNPVLRRWQRHIPVDVMVSTIFIGIDHRFDEEQGEPLVFETMIFGGKYDGRQWRCATLAQAKRHHRFACSIAGDVS